MLRSVTLALVLSVLAAACALVDQPPPAGTIILRGEVRNNRGPVELEVTTPAGVVTGGVQPASLPADSTTQVTFHVPITGEWTIMVNGSPDITVADPRVPDRWDISADIRAGCKMEIHLDADGSLGSTCVSQPKESLLNVPSDAAPAGALPGPP